MNILDYRIGLSDKTSKGILDSGFNLDGSEMSPEQQQQYEQFKQDNNMSSISVGSQPVAMGMPITMNDAVPLNEQLGYYPKSGIMQMQNRGTLDYPEVNWKMITEGPNMRGGLIPNPDYIPYEQGEHYNIEENVNPSLIDRGKEALGIGKDAIENAINYGLGAISGIPFVGPAIDFIGNQFEYRPAEIYTDEYGRIYNPEALDRMNARGGWYTEPARASRRRDKRIDWLEKRREEGKKFSEKNLARLKEQQRQEEAARQSAAAAIQASNRDRGIGGYQSSWGGDSDFMEGPAGREAFSGDTDLSAYMGST